MVIGLYIHESAEPQNGTMGVPNGYAQACAEKLVLLGEMLATASQYLTQCGEVMQCEDSLMLGIAADEIPSLRRRCMELGKDLGGFEKRIREHIRKSPRAE